jgi:hypothetical protein
MKKTLTIYIYVLVNKLVNLLSKSKCNVLIFLYVNTLLRYQNRNTIQLSLKLSYIVMHFLRRKNMY